MWDMTGIAAQIAPQEATIAMRGSRQKKAGCVVCGKLYRGSLGLSCLGARYLRGLRICADGLRDDTSGLLPRPSEPGTGHSLADSPCGRSWRHSLVGVLAMGSKAPGRGPGGFPSFHPHWPVFGILHCDGDNPAVTNSKGVTPRGRPVSQREGCHQYSMASQIMGAIAAKVKMPIPKERNWFLTYHHRSGGGSGPILTRE